ncbi:hypothetical protein Tco_1279503, partial [Tanacetum coccineum]
MVDFVPGRAVIDAAQRKRGKYIDRCADIGYGFISFSFSSMGELEAGAVTLLKRIRKFSITQDIGARTTIHIFNRISFAIAKGSAALQTKLLRHVGIVATGSTFDDALWVFNTAMEIDFL